MSKTEEAAKRPRSGARPNSELLGKKGDALEHRVARLFIHLGFYVRRSRQLYTVGRLNQATDLDVFAVRYGAPFRRETQICECKSGAEGPLDRIFWLAGVKKYVGASSAMLVRKSTKWNIKDFAVEVGVEVLDLPRLDEMERNLGIVEDRWIGASDQSYFEGERRAWEAALAKDQILKELFLTLAGEVRFHDPFGGINYLLHHLRALTHAMREARYESASLIRFLMCECVGQLAIFLMRVAEISAGLHPSDQQGLLRKGLVYGDLDSKFAERILRNAQRLTGELVRHYTGKPIVIDENLFVMPAPPELPQIEIMIGKLVGKPAVSTTFVALVDLLVTERYLKNRVVTDSVNSIFRFVDIKERLLLVTDYFHFLESIDAIPGALWRDRSAQVQGVQGQQDDLFGAVANPQASAPKPTEAELQKTPQSS